MPATGAMRSRKLQRLLNLRWWDASPGQTLQVSSITPFEVMPGPDAGAKVAESVATHEAVGDGTTDDTQSVRDAIDAAGGIPTFFPEGTYRLTEQIVLPALTDLYLPAGAVLDISEVPAGTPAFTAVGSTTDSVALDVGATAGDASVSVASGAEAAFAAGDLVQIRSENQPDSGSAKDGELHVVLSTIDGQVNLKGALNDGYATADSATIDRLDPVDNITIRGRGTIRHSGADGTIGALFDRCRGVTIDGVTWEDCAERAIEAEKCWDVDFDATVRRGNQSGFGYGIVLTDGVHHARVRGQFEDCRHALSGGGSSTGYGVNRHTDALVHAYGGIGAGLDGHANCQHWKFHNSHIESREGDGIVWQGRDAEICDNTVRALTKNAILVQPQHADVDAITIDNNTCDAPASQQGILVKVEKAITLFNLTMDGNTVFGTPQRGIYILIDATGAAIDNFAVQGGTIRNVTSEGIMVRAISGSNISWGNIGGVTIDASGGTQAIELFSDGPTVERIAIVGNSCRGGAIEKNGAGVTDSNYVEGNIVPGGINNFAAAEVGDNRTT